MFYKGQIVHIEVSFVSTIIVYDLLQKPDQPTLKTAKQKQKAQCAYYAMYTFLYEVSIMNLDKSGLIWNLASHLLDTTEQQAGQ